MSRPPRDFAVRLLHRADARSPLTLADAVDQHYGGLGGGHYTALAKNVDANEWYSFDDSRVSKIDESAIVVSLSSDIDPLLVRTQTDTLDTLLRPLSQTPAAYVLFYRRRTSRPIGGSSRVKAEQAEQVAREKAASASASAAGSPHLATNLLPPLPASGRTSPVSSTTPTSSSTHTISSSSGDYTSRPHPHKISGLAGFLHSSFGSGRHNGAGGMASPPASDGGEEEVDMFSGSLGEGVGGRPPSYDGGSEGGGAEAGSSPRADEEADLGGGYEQLHDTGRKVSGELDGEGDIGEEALRDVV